MPFSRKLHRPFSEGTRTYGEVYHGSV